MAWMTSKRSRHGDLTVSGTPEDVRRRLDDRLLRIGNPWFPTRTELKEWEDSAVPFYIIRSKGNEVEVGPRLNNLWAACFSPVLRGTLAATDSGTTITWDRSWLRITSVLLWGWTAVLAVWLAVLVPQIASGSEHPIWLLWWTIVAATRVAATLLGGHYGGLEMEQHMPWLNSAATEEIVEEEDW